MKSTVIVAVAYIVIKDKKLLLTRSKGKKAFYMPGGKPKKEEGDIDTLVRELNEELSLAVEHVSLAHFGTFEAQAYGESEGVIVQLRCYIGTHTGVPQPQSEIEEMRHFSYGEYMQMNETAPAVRLLFQSLKTKGL